MISMKKKQNLLLVGGAGLSLLLAGVSVVLSGQGNNSLLGEGAYPSAKAMSITFTADDFKAGAKTITKNGNPFSVTGDVTVTGDVITFKQGASLTRAAMADATASTNGWRGANGSSLFYEMEIDGLTVAKPSQKVVHAGSTRTWFEVINNRGVPEVMQRPHIVQTVLQRRHIQPVQGRGGRQQLHQPLRIHRHGAVAPHRLAVACQHVGGGGRAVLQRRKTEPRQRRLSVTVHQYHAPAAPPEHVCQIEGRDGLSDPALQVHNCDRSHNAPFFSPGSAGGFPGMYTRLCAAPPRHIAPPGGSTPPRRAQALP